MPGLTSPQQVVHVFLFALSKTGNPTFIEILNALPADILFLIDFLPAADPVFKMRNSGSFDGLLIFDFLPLDLFVELVVGIVEGLPDVVNHPLVPVFVFHIDGDSQLELFHLFAFAEQFYFLVHLGGVLHCLEELLLPLPVLLEG